MEINEGIKSSRWIRMGGHYELKVGWNVYTISEENSVWYVGRNGRNINFVDSLARAKQYVDDEIEMAG